VPNAVQVTLSQAGPIPLNVAFSCGSNELLALVGPSGSGKTTTLRAIAGLYRPMGGRIVVGAQTWLDSERDIYVPANRRSVGLVFQSYALFPHMTALGNIMAAMGHRPRAERSARAHELLDMVHLGGLHDRRPAALSGGQQQRVAVARALAREPQLLLFDEPFSAVDRRTRRLLHAQLKELRTLVSVPIIMVTHDLAEVADLADRMCVIDGGDTLQIGTPREVMKRPANQRVRDALDVPLEVL